MIASHPMSSGFDWDTAVPTHPRTTLTDEQWNQFNSDGYFVVENLVDPTTLAEVTAETDIFCEEADSFLEKLPDSRMFIAEKGAITFAPNIALKSDALLKFVSSSPMTGLVHDLIGPDARLYHDQAVYKANEKPRRFPWHQDNGYTFVLPEHYLTIWIALNDVPIEAGCVWAAPGLHKSGTLLHTYVEPLGWEIFEDPPVTPIAAPIAAGGAVVFSSLTPHLTGPNVSDHMRKAYILQYVGPDAIRFDGPHDKLGTPLTDDARFPWVLRNGTRV